MSGDHETGRHSDGRRRKRILEGYKAKQRALLDELAKVGVEIGDVYELDSWTAPYPAAVPILIEHLGRTYPPTVRRGIVYALRKKWAHDLAFQVLVDTYRREPNDDRPAGEDDIGSHAMFKQSLADAIAAMAKPQEMELLLDLASNKENGSSRMLFIQRLSRSRSSRIKEALLRLAESQPDLRYSMEKHTSDKR